MTFPIVVENLGTAPYRSTLDAMRQFTDQRSAATADQIWLLQHEPIFTQGLAGKPEHLLDAHGVEVVPTERGGQITYHGPGQVIAYLLIDLRRRGIKVREFVHALEDAAIQTLAAYNVRGERKPGAPGIYVLEPLHGELQKIVALGLKIKNGCTYHGISFNVAMDLTPFSWINPCGYAGLRTIDLATLGVNASCNNVATQLAEALVNRINQLTLLDLNQDAHESRP